MLAGVSGGLASYFEIHPAFFRVGFVVLTLLGGAGLLIYFAAALVMPDEGTGGLDRLGGASRPARPALAADRARRCSPSPARSCSRTRRCGRDGDAWFVLLLAGAAILWITRTRKATEPAAPTRRRSRPGPTRIAIRRVLHGIAIAIASLVALVLIAAAIFASIVHVHPGRGVGDRTYYVASVSRTFATTIGSASATCRLDLGNVQLPTGRRTSRRASTSAGLEVVVPPDVALARARRRRSSATSTSSATSSDGHDVDRTVDAERRARARRSTRTSAPDRSTSNAPYDEPGCRSRPSRRVTTNASSRGSARESRRPSRST